MKTDFTLSILGLTPHFSHGFHIYVLGCFNNVVDNRDGGKPCGLDESEKKSGVEVIDALPQRYQSILSCYRSTKDMKDKGNWKGALWDCSKNPGASVLSHPHLVP